MKILRYTLVADGTSDTMLLPIINWVIADNFPRLSYQPQFARDLGNVGHGLQARISTALSLFPCDVLFVHRDAENQSRTSRLNEINDALEGSVNGFVPIIPVRMSESWMLSDIAAIRAAAGNPNGRVRLNIPNKGQWEKISDPKEVLFSALRDATEKVGRQLTKFNPHRQRSRVTELTSDFSELRGLPSFDFFENDLVNQLRGMPEYALD